LHIRTIGVDINACAWYNSPKFSKERNYEMKKLMVAALAASFVGFALADSASKTEPEAGQAAAAEEEEEDGALFEFGFDADIYTAYVYRNQVYNDRPVAQPCVWADFVGLDPFYFGFYIWQNYDLTNRRREEMRGEWNETDYNVHLGATVWSNDEETMSLGIEVGHEWFVSLVKSEYDKDYASTCEIYVKAEFETPFVTPYALASRMYRYLDGMHYELGLKREFVLMEEMPLGESLTLGADWNVDFGSGKYLDYLYGVGRGYYEENDEGDFMRGNKDGIGGTTLKLVLTWQLCENFSLGGVAAYTSLLNESIRNGYRDSGWWGNYKDDLVWGGVQAKLEF
jgi:hypothetical protein